MRTVLSTDEIQSRNKFKPWCELLRERYFPLEGIQYEEASFIASLKEYHIGNMPLRKLYQTPAQYSLPSKELIRNKVRDDFIIIRLRKGGVAHTVQHDRLAIQKTGDIVVSELKPMTLSYKETGSEYAFPIERSKIEKLLGPAKIFSALTLNAEHGSTSLVNKYFAELLRVQSRLSDEAVSRMSSIGVDLIIASIADRLARETPKSLQGTVVVQRAKSFIEDNIGDTTLDATKLAAAVGISLRRLQELFQKQERNISEWIWERRLDTAAARLLDKNYSHIQIGNLAYGCGFTSQQHFSRRFKQHFGMTPREYRYNTKV